LKKAIPNISEKMLIQHLKELEADKLILRKAMPVVPPHVEYSLTDQGQELTPILGAMCTWAEKYNV
jgi:DNA-binding HxlR family transcriptional regulator